jgi:disulfide bond formation protein DsbB
MHQALPMKPTWGGRFRNRPLAGPALAIFVLGLATLGGAWYFQFFRHLPPCPLCLEERIPYYVVIPLSLLLAIGALAGAPRRALSLGFIIVGITALCGAVLGAYHAGVEWHFWQGPTDCTGTLTDLTAHGSLLNQLQSFNVVRCDEAAWRLLGISLAGYNVLISLLMTAVAAVGLLRRERSA